MGRTNLPAHIRQLVPAATQAQQAGHSDAKAVLLAQMSEREFQAHVVALARRLGYAVWHDSATNAPRACYACHAPTRGPRNVKGLPDLLLVRGDRLIWAELKAQAGSTSPEQREWIARLRAAGQTVYVWRPRDEPTIVEVLT